MYVMAIYITLLLTIHQSFATNYYYYYGCCKVTKGKNNIYLFILQDLTYILCHFTVLGETVFLS